MIAERAGELSGRIKVTDNGVVSLVWDITRAAGKGAYFKFSVYCLGRVPAPSDLLQRFDSRRVPVLPDNPDVALSLRSS